VSKRVTEAVFTLAMALFLLTVFYAATALPMP
jgi:hypothetical protein